MNIMVYQSVRGRGPHFTVVRGGAVVVIIEHPRNFFPYKENIFYFMHACRQLV
jgi:hypothetical protein